MNRLWVRLSLSYSAVLVLVLSIPMALAFTGFLVHNRWRHVENGLWMLPRIGFATLFYLTLITLFSLFVGVVAGILVSRNLGKQVSQLVDATKTISPENLDHRVEVEGVQELQELAQSFNRMIGELDQAQQTRRNLLADVSHELLTPLTVLEGNLRAMLDGVYAVNEEEVSYLYDQTHHLIGLVKDLRQLTKAEAHQLDLDRQPTQLNEIVEETVSLFESLASEKGVALRQVAYADLPDLHVDRKRIRQVLSNLLSNALRHTPQDGTVTIETRLADGTALLSVKDTGEGLSEADAEHIFERFYRTNGSARRDAGGAGLGLAIVKALAEAHGGQVTASSNQKGPSSDDPLQMSSGATFTVSLPVSAENA